MSCIARLRREIGLLSSERRSTTPSMMPRSVKCLAAGGSLGCSKQVSACPATVSLQHLEMHACCQYYTWAKPPVLGM